MTNVCGDALVNMRGKREAKPSMIRDAFAHLGADAVVLSLGVACQIILAHLVIKQEYGLWVMLGNAAGTFFLVVHFGLPTLVARDVPKNPHLARNYAMRFMRIQAVFFVIIALVVFVLRGQFFSEEISFLLLMFVVLDLGFHYLSSVPRTALRALGRAPWEATIRIAERSAVTIGLLLLLLSGTSQLWAIALVGMSSNILSAGMMLFAFRLASQPRSKGLDASAVPSVKKVLWFALPLFLTLWFQRILWDVNEIALGVWEGYESVATYHVAWLVIGGALSIPLALRQAMLPVFGACEPNSKELSDVLRKALRFTTLLTPIGMPFIVLGGIFVLPLVFPPVYLDGGWSGASPMSLVVIMSLAWTMAMFASPFSVAVLVHSNTWRYALQHGTALVAGVVGALLFIPLIGLVGAAVGCVLAMSVRLLMGIKLSGWYHEFRHLCSTTAVLCTVMTGTLGVTWFGLVLDSNTTVFIGTAMSVLSLYAGQKVLSQWLHVREETTVASLA